MYRPSTIRNRLAWRLKNLSFRTKENYLNYLRVRLEEADFTTPWNTRA
jgi:hypothetical protein